MSRIEVAAKALFLKHSNTNGPSLSDIWDTQLSDDLKSPFVRDAAAALAAADAHDRANGIHRIAMDDATVERAARALIVSIWKIPNAWEIASQRERDGLTAHARITLAASMEAIK